jgi:hypothetical protein
MLPFCGFYPTQNLVSIVDEQVLWCSGIGLALLYTILLARVDQQHPTPAGVFFFVFFQIILHEGNLRISNKK